MRTMNPCAPGISCCRTEQSALYLQKVHACGKTEKHCCTYSLPLQWHNCPCENLRLMNVQPNGTIETILKNDPCKTGMVIQVKIPLLLYFENCNECFTATSFITENIPLKSNCLSDDLWHDQPHVDASVRLCRENVCIGNNACTASLDIYLQAYLLSGCVVNTPCCSHQETAIPWYPQPSHRSYR